MENSPKVVDLVGKLAILRTVKGWTVNDLRLALNEFLANPLPDCKPAKSQVDRWIHPYRKGWVEPRGEIVLAMQGVLAKHESR